MEQEETQRLLMMESEMKQRVIGQDEAVNRHQQSFASLTCDLKDPRRPDRFVRLSRSNWSRQKRIFARTSSPNSCSVTPTPLIQIDMSEYMGKVHRFAF